MTEEMSSISVGMLTIMSRVFASCFDTPLTHSWLRKACGSATSSAVTIHGPSGVKVSKDLRVTRSSSATPGSMRMVMSIRQL